MRNTVSILQPFLPHDGGNNMKYTFTITDKDGKASEMKEMSWKKLLKRLTGKTCWVSYINKKGHLQVRNFNNGKETKKR